MKPLTKWQEELYIAMCALFVMALLMFVVGAIAVVIDLF